MSPIAFLLLFLGMMVTITGMTLYNYYFHLWWRTKVVGAPVAFAELFRMNFKRISPKPVVEAYTTAVQGGLNLAIRELADHCQQGGNAMRVVENLIEARLNGGDLDFESACAQDLAEGGILSFTGQEHRG